VVRMACSPAPAPARSRLRMSLAACVLSALFLAPGEEWIAAVAQDSGSVPAGVAEAATSTKKSTSGAKATARSTTTKKRTTTASKSRTHRKTTAKKSRRTHARPSKGVNARAAVLIDAQTGEVLFDKNSGTPMPIASLTKLMTAMVFLESKPDLSKRVMKSHFPTTGNFGS